uniref:CSON008316 protein n=1 Tax=Culicoides sonorensis TaxID=179676 RepID=A0A336M3Z6_CULSO
MRKLNVGATMSRPSKPTQAKKVAPPAVPEIYRHSGSSFGSVGYASSDDGGFITQPPDSPLILSLKSEDQTDCSSSVSSVNNSSNSMLSKSPGVTYIPPNTFTFSARGEPLTHKTAVIYHQSLALQQEDQGIDLTQSPGRDSPGSSSGSAGSGSRHSTASLDSGRASSYVTGTSSNRGALSSPRYSVSSCSIGSVDRMTQRSDHDIITEWLSEIHFDEYAQLFAKAGYDLWTISRMTPEDLTAIGIKKPHDREKIKQHIDALQLPDSLPNYVPGSLDEWLRLLRLEEYVQPLLAQGYQSVCDVTTLTWEDLEDIGIIKLGHQKKILLAIKRVKDIVSGKVASPGITPHGQQPQLYLNLQEIQQLQQKPLLSQQQQQQTPHKFTQSQYIMNPPQLYYVNQDGDDIFVPNNYKQHLSLWNEHHLNSSGGNQGLTQRYSMFNTTTSSVGIVNGCDEIHELGEDDNDLIELNGTGENDIVLIKLRQPPGKSLDTIEDAQEAQRASSHFTFNRHTMLPQDAAYYTHPGIHPQTMMNVLPMQYSGLLNQNNTWRRSYDDGDITPTNENFICTEGGGTLPRHNRSGINRSRPVAKVIATNLMQQPTSNIPLQQQQPPIMMSDLSFKQMPATKCFTNHCNPPVGMIGSPMMGKKHPPEPPRRQFSSPAQIEQFSGHFTETLNLNSTQPTSNQQIQSHYAIPTYQSYHFSPHLPHNYQHYQQHNQPVYANFIGGQQHQTTVEVHAEKINDSKSNSSIDSIDAIPFANDNAGTIKQRAMVNRHETSLTSLSSSSSSSSCSGASSKSTSSSASVTTTIAGNASKLAALKLSQSPTSASMSTGVSNSNSGVIVNPESNMAATTTNTSTELVDTNVLNDIGNMLANLTDELDAMLEEEKRAGINDSE